MQQLGMLLAAYSKPWFHDPEQCISGLFVLPIMHNLQRATYQAKGEQECRHAQRPQKTPALISPWEGRASKHTIWSDSKQKLSLTSATFQAEASGFCCSNRKKDLFEGNKYLNITSYHILIPKQQSFIDNRLH